MENQVEKQQYWQPTSMICNDGLQLEARTRFAFILMQQWGMVCGKPGPEDSAGRCTIDLLSPLEIVDRAFAVADLFVDAAERRHEIRVQTEEMEALACARQGELERIKSEAKYQLPTHVEELTAA